MAFTKYATISVSKLTSATWSGDSLAFDKTAANGSMYGSNTNVINVRELLGKVASEYEISADPKDYIFEAVRAVTAEVPNQNADEFSREELLRFDHKIGQKVYQTFILKPHQINHRADNPKTARGVVLDAYYNDTSKALDACPTCNNRTAEVSGRDSSGLNCSKCGTTVKDEFVELLLAVDTKKDPTFADGVKSGALDSLSMGCLAMYTDCSICNNRAHTASDFCSHIRGGNKKKMFKTGSGEKMAYERCGGVTFTEISRVDQPADPTAKQKELFSLSAMPLQVESEMLMMSAKIAKLEAQINKAAQSPASSYGVRYWNTDEGGIGRDEAIAKILNGTIDHVYVTRNDPAKRRGTLDINLGFRGGVYSGKNGLGFNPNNKDDPANWTKEIELQTTQYMGRKLSAAELEELFSLIESIAANSGAADKSDAKCECGVDAVGGGIHSSWCPKHKKAQVDEPSHPQVPFKTVAESIKWAQKSISTLRGNIARLTAEKEAKIKSASEEGRPFYAWENAAYTSQIKANLQYISRLENYVTRAAGLVESGQPWGKDLTRSMSRFFANKVAQSMPEDLKQDLDELGRAHPEMYNDIIKDLGIDPSDPNMTPGSTQPQGMSMGQYQEKQEQSLDQNMTAEEMGIKVDEGAKINPAMNVTSTIEEDLTNRVTAILEAFEENDTVTTTNLKFADTYKHLEASVTKGGNVKVFTKAGTLFVVRPAVKPADEAAGVKLATEVLASIAEDGIVGAVAKYKTVLGPKFAQVLQFHMEDFDGGREDGDKKPSHEGGENDLADDREKPEMSLGKEETDRKDEERDGRDQSNADTLEEHEPDHKEKLPKGLTPATEEEHSDRAESREKKPKTTLDDNELDHKGASKAAALPPEFLKNQKGKKKDESSGDDKKDGAPKKDKKAQTAPGQDAGGMQVCALGDMCADVNCPEHGKGAQAPGGMQMAPGAPPAAPAAPGMAPMAMTAADKTYISRMERLYKNRMKTTAEDYSKKLAEADKTAAAKIASKFTRALKLAAKRQAVNLEVSPIKSAMFDVLTSEVDIDSDSFFPGMDAVTASKLIEATSTSGFDSFVDSLVKRASEFVAMSDDAFTALEADVKNLQPASVVVQASAEVRTASVKNNVRQAAVEGNMAIAPSPVEDIISRNTPRNSIRSALGATKVHRATQNLSKK